MFSFLYPAKFCLYFTLSLLGICHIFIDLFSITFAVPAFSITVSLLFLVMFLVRIPPPNKSAVEEIVGKNPLVIQNTKNTFIVRTVAHRGAGLDAPENTLEAFKNCASKGINFIELDVHLSQDGVPIVFHDDDLERMANQKICIEKTPYKELREIDLSIKHPFRTRYENSNIPTLDDTIEQLLYDNQRMFLDIKYNDKKMVDAILKVFKKYDQLHSRAIVTSFFPNLIYAIRKKDPKIVCSLAWRPYAFRAQGYSYPLGAGPSRSHNIFVQYVACLLDWFHSYTLPRLTYYLLGISLILLHKDCISGETVLDWHNKGVRVMAWTVNHPVEKQYFSKILKVTYLTDTLTGENNCHDG